MEKNKSKLQSTLTMTLKGLKSSHPWHFKVYFRTGIYSWRGSQLASKRLKEAFNQLPGLSLASSNDNLMLNK